MPYVENRPAGFWIRFLAFFIDGILMSAFAYLVAVVIRDHKHLESFKIIGSERYYTTAGMIADNIYIILFIIIFTATLKGSLGKLICRIQVVNQDHSTISLLKSIGRYFAHIVSIFTIIGVVMVGLNKRKKGLHDLLCQTVVVYRNQYSDPTDW
ncbi:RDD family protein [Alkalibacillus silvisoli]|uniref:RDD family protein n=1 Tax=Alkalibacillus silvisoli TaxID=392823 RepID=A0ABN0ZZM8_9BACI